MGAAIAPILGSIFSSVVSYGANQLLGGLFGGGGEEEQQPQAAPLTASWGPSAISGEATGGDYSSMPASAGASGILGGETQATQPTKDTSSEYQGNIGTTSMVPGAQDMLKNKPSSIYTY